MFALTGLACIQRIITDLAVIDVTPAGLALIELAPEVTVEHVRRLTGPDLHLALTPPVAPTPPNTAEAR
ncbi:hypothetical protein ACGFWI_14050 [Streptomyces sp. NPDC048434]|uniref:hypothetical protein n=1 Tax=Streptomyces sp. NPDC048434 TaxID=3365549 RepID=UPI003723161E